jgi:DNA replication protein DnaC
MKTSPDVTAQIKSHCRTLKLRIIEKTLDDHLAVAHKEQLPLCTVLETLLGSEARSILERRIERRIKESKLPERKLLSDFDFSFQPKLDKSQIMELATLSFVQRKQGVIFAGASGTGKSHLAKALLLIGCQMDYRCRYTTAADMLKNLLSGLADGSLEHKLKLYTSPQILLIDEVGFDRLEQESARNASLFFKVIDGRYCKASTILTTNIDFKALGDYLGDPVVTTAIVDRMIHHASIISIDGPSYRMYESKKINRKSEKTKH